jgi:hypothetical protein
MKGGFREGPKEGSPSSQSKFGLFSLYNGQIYEKKVEK